MASLAFPVLVVEQASMTLVTPVLVAEVVMGSCTLSSTKD